jgi:hypothetical protein
MLLGGLRNVLIGIPDPDLGNQAIFLHEPPDFLRVQDNGLPLQIHPNNPPTSLAVLLLEAILDEQMLPIIRPLPLETARSTVQPTIIAAAANAEPLAGRRLSISAYFSDGLSTSSFRLRRVFLAARSPLRDI